MKNTNQPKRRCAAVVAANSRNGGFMRHKSNRRSKDARKSWKKQEW